MPSDNPNAKIKVNWLPNVSGRPGTQFFAKYRIRGESTWLRTDDIKDDDFVVIHGLETDETYEFVVVSVDGNHLTESHIQDVRTLGEN